MDRPHLPAHPCRQHYRVRRSAVHPPCVPRARGVVRKLSPATGHHPDCAHVPALRHHRRLLKGSDNNIFTQIGFIVLVGLACKNAILIVEFARTELESGKDRIDAVVEACRIRLRPILMTSFAFILGVLPLVMASGAGAEMRQALGTAVFSGMIGVTFFGLLLTPIFFVLLSKSRAKRLARIAETAATAGSGGTP